MKPFDCAFPTRTITKTGSDGGETRGYRKSPRKTDRNELVINGQRKGERNTTAKKTGLGTRSKSAKMKCVHQNYVDYVGTYVKSICFEYR